MGMTFGMISTIALHKPTGFLFEFTFSVNLVIKYLCSYTYQNEAAKVLATGLLNGTPNCNSTSNYPRPHTLLDSLVPPNIPSSPTLPHSSLPELLHPIELHIPKTTAPHPLQLHITWIHTPLDPLPPRPQHLDHIPVSPNRVLCTVLVTIPWAGPPSVIEFHSMDNKICVNRDKNMSHCPHLGKR